MCVCGGVGGAVAGVGEADFSELKSEGRLDVANSCQARLGSVRWVRSRFLGIFSPIECSSAGERLWNKSSYFSSTLIPRAVVLPEMVLGQAALAFHSHPPSTKKYMPPFALHSETTWPGIGQASAGLSQARRGQARLDSARLGWLKSVWLELDTACFGLPPFGSVGLDWARFLPARLASACLPLVSFQCARLECGLS